MKTICLNCLTANDKDSTECYECGDAISYVPITMTPRQLGQAFRRLGPNPDPIAFNKLRAQEAWRRIEATDYNSLITNCLNCRKPVTRMKYCTCGSQINQ